MSVADSFTRFHALPSELRLQVWSEAVSVRVVWAAVRNHKMDYDPNTSRLSFKMVYIGSAPYLAGLSSREARRLLEQTYGTPLRGPFGGRATSTGRYWVDLDTTVVYLGDPLDVMTILNSFGADELSMFQHVALSWYQFGMLARTCQRLATTCPALRNVVIQSCDTEAATTRPLCQPLSLKTAAYYATIPESTGGELGYETLDVSHLRSLLLKYFGASPPRLHLLPTESANRL